MTAEELRSFNVRQVARIYQVTAQTVYAWIGAGRMNTFRTPRGHIRVLLPDEVVRTIAKYNELDSIEGRKREKA